LTVCIFIICINRYVAKPLEAHSFQMHSLETYTWKHSYFLSSQNQPGGEHIISAQPFWKSVVPLGLVLGSWAAPQQGRWNTAGQVGVGRHAMCRGHLWSIQNGSAQNNPTLLAWTVSPSYVLRIANRSNNLWKRNNGLNIT
jgi:hypothetical protein